jgi:dihydroflavonol-4-reductase
MKVLVTGANGLIGANLVRELLARGAAVRALVRESSDLTALAGLDLEIHRADVSHHPEAVLQALSGCELAFHTAMHFSYERRRAGELAAAATQGTENLLRAAAAAGVRRVVLTSSSVVFGHRVEPLVLDESAPPAAAEGEGSYVSAKIRQDALAFALGASLGLEVVAACPTVSVGPHATALGPSNGMIVAYLADPFRLTYPGGCNLVSTADVAAGHWLAAQRGEPGQHYILGSENLTWTALHRLIAELAGVDPPRVELNHGLSYLAAAAEELRARIAGRSALSNREQATMVGRYYWYSHDKAAALGYRPRPARQALAEALSWLVKSPHVSRELRAGLRLHDDVYAARGWTADAGRTCGEAA